jgi:predicted ATP-grasp superfamily ATP-dependent carboligase
MNIPKHIKDSLKRHNKPVALILGKYITTGLGVSRSLGEKKIPTFWLDCNPYQAGFLSKYCYGIISPDSKKSEKKFINFLISIGNELKNKGVLFPIGDIEVISILKNKEKLSQYFHIPIADFKITNILLDKKIFYSKLKKLNITYPKTYISENLSDIKKIVKKVAYPCIVKPSNSEYFRAVFNNKFFWAENKKQLLKGYKKAVTKKIDVMIQEIIPGDSRCMYGLNAYFNKKSNAYGMFIYRRIREFPHKSGNGVFIEKSKGKEFNEIVTELVKKIKFYGILDAEFKIDPRNKKINLIEVNPRCWMQVSLPQKYGINLPYAAYLDAIGKKIKDNNSKNKSIKWVFAYQDFLAAYQDMKNHDLSLLEWLSTYRGKKEYAVFSWKDPLPFFRFIRKRDYYY